MNLIYIEIEDKAYSLMNAKNNNNTTNDSYYHYHNYNKSCRLEEKKKSSNVWFKLLLYCYFSPPKSYVKNILDRLCNSVEFLIQIPQMFLSDIYFIVEILL